MFYVGLGLIVGLVLVAKTKDHPTAMTRLAVAAVAVWAVALAVALIWGYLDALFLGGMSGVIGLALVLGRLAVALSRPKDF